MLMARDNDDPDLAAAELALLRARRRGAAVARVPLGETTPSGPLSLPRPSTASLRRPRRPSQAAAASPIHDAAGPSAPGRSR